MSPCCASIIVLLFLSSSHPHTHPPPFLHYTSPPHYHLFSSSPHNLLTACSVSACSLLRSLRPSPFLSHLSPSPLSFSVSLAAPILLPPQKTPPHHVTVSCCCHGNRLPIPGMRPQSVLNSVFLILQRKRFTYYIVSLAFALSNSKMLWGNMVYFSALCHL